MTGVAHRAYREARDLLLESYGGHDAAAARFESAALRNPLAEAVTTATADR